MWLCESTSSSRKACDFGTALSSEKEASMATLILTGNVKMQFQQ